jgi:hypothetical protein
MIVDCRLSIEFQRNLQSQITNLLQSMIYDCRLSIEFQRNLQSQITNHKSPIFSSLPLRRLLSLIIIAFLLGGRRTVEHSARCNRHERWNGRILIVRIIERSNDVPE